ncbi:HNH endonuclease [Tomitella gaofuii]|uniref:HNH endonuclease n=1 Tax=Tomitella gaofuii TaxID=2760083 RepID=UPI0039A6AF2E
MAALRATVLKRDGYRCRFCGGGGRLEVDHVVPWSAGGADVISNLRTLCQSCNQTRSNFRSPADEPQVPVVFGCVECSDDLWRSYDREELCVSWCVACGEKGLAPRRD